MRSTNDEFERAADQLNANPQRLAPSPFGQRQLNGRVLSSLAILFSAGVWLLWSLTGQVTEDDPVVSSTTSTHDSESVFQTPLPWTLLIADRASGIISIDLNERFAVRSALGGREGGEVGSFDSLLGHLVVRAEQVYAIDMQTGGIVTLGEASSFVTAVGHDSVWLVETPSPAETVNPTVARVSVAGTEMTPPATVDVDGIPRVGIEGGLAIDTERGIALWDGSQVSGYLGSDGATVFDAFREGRTVVAWCERGCFQIILSDASGSQIGEFEHPSGKAFDPGSARFASDNRFLAATAGSDVLVVDTETAEVTVAISGTEKDQWQVAWAPFGPELFAMSPGDLNRPTLLAHYNALTMETSTTHADLGDVALLEVATTFDAGALVSSRSDVAECVVTEAGEPWKLAYCRFAF